MFQEGDILCSKYQLLRRFNEGGFSSVWLARDMTAQMDFALKIYDNVEDMDSFRRGFRLVCNLNHNNIFKPLAYHVHMGNPFLVMPYCAKGSVSSHIGKMTEDELWKFVYDVANGLAYLHDQKAIVHQDIKPGNILIDDDDTYMITDFDISTRQSSTIRMTARQVEEMQDFNYGSGTPDYMGPERWPDTRTGYRPSIKPMQASDIWSFGATLFELMEGYTPFGETGGACQRNMHKEHHSHCLKNHGAPKMVSKYSKQLKKLTITCLSENAWDRPSAKQIAQGAIHHKAPKQHPVPMPQWFKISATIAVVGSTAFASWKVLNREIIDPINNDSIYTTCIDVATAIVREQAALSESQKDYTFDIKKVAEAYDLYEKADTLKHVSDSVKINGQKAWSASQEIINMEYHRLDSLEHYYRILDATEAALNFAQHRYEIEKYVTNK